VAGDRGAKTTVHGFFVKFVCCGQWLWVQALDPDRVAELAATFRAGEFGMNILKRPALLEHDGQPKRDALGARLLSDGKHTVAALQDPCRMQTE